MMTPRISPALLDDMNMIGLRLVAAMSKECAPAKKSDPIPIKSRVGPTVKIKVKEEVDDDDVELSESYTCVISRLGATVKKREYVNGYDYCCGSVDNGIRSKFEMNSGVILEYSPMGVAPVGDFLSYCCLCRKRLRDLDIFMYSQTTIYLYENIWLLFVVQKYHEGYWQPLSFYHGMKLRFYPYRFLRTITLAKSVFPTICSLELT